MRPFSRSLPMLLLRAREVVMREFRPFLAANDLTEQQWRVLRALGATDDPMSVGELAERTMLLGPSLSRILVNLDERGLIVRSLAHDDARRAVITIANAGLDLVQRLAPFGEAKYLEVESLFGADRLDDLYEQLDRLIAIRDEAADTDG